MPVFRVEKSSNYNNDVQLPPAGSGSQPERERTSLHAAQFARHMELFGTGVIFDYAGCVDGVLTALKELERLGYLERNQQRESNGRMGRAEYVIYEMPREKAVFGITVYGKAVYGKSGYGHTGYGKSRAIKY